MVNQLMMNKEKRRTNKKSVREKMRKKKLSVKEKRRRIKKLKKKMRKRKGWKINREVLP